MGTWGTSIFENDNASDWVFELEGSVGSTVLKKTLTDVVDVGDAYLEAPVAACGLAAVEVVACLKHSPADKLPKEVKHWIEVQGSRMENDLVPLALRALERIRGKNCELLELWQESSDYSAWQSELVALEARLKQGNE